jgi:hypothetical protein
MLRARVPAWSNDEDKHGRSEDLLTPDDRLRFASGYTQDFLLDIFD